MKVEIKNDPHNNGAVHINHITMVEYKHGILLSIDTKEKYPTFFISYSFQNGKCNQFTIYFHTETKDTITVSVIPETKREKNILKDGYILDVCNRYGPNFLLVPGLPKDFEQILLYEAPDQEIKKETV